MPRTERISVRVTPEERARIATGAALVGQSLSAFLRTAALAEADRVLDRRDLIATIDAHLATATRHPAGTTDRLRGARPRAAVLTHPADDASYQDLCPHLRFFL